MAASRRRSQEVPGILGQASAHRGQPHGTRDQCIAQAAIGDVENPIPYGLGGEIVLDPSTKVERQTLGDGDIHVDESNLPEGGERVVGYAAMT